MKKVFGQLAPTAVALIWGVTLICNKVALQTFDPINLIILRFVIASAGFGLLFAVKAIPFKRVEKADVPRFLLLVLLGVFVGNLALTYGQRFLPTTIAILIVQSAPLFTAGLAICLGQQRTSLRLLLGLLISAIGSAVVAVHVGGWPELNAPWYIYPLTFIAPLCVASFMLVGRPLAVKYGAANLSAQTFTLGGMVLGLTAAMSPSLFNQVSSAGTEELSAVVLLGLGATVVAYMLWFYALKRKTASQLSVYLNLIPAFGFIFTNLILGETITPELVLSAAVIVAGVAITETAAHRQDPK